MAQLLNISLETITYYEKQLQRPCEGMKLL